LLILPPYMLLRRLMLWRRLPLLSAMLPRWLMLWRLLCWDMLLCARDSRRSVAFLGPRAALLLCSLFLLVFNTDSVRRLEDMLWAALRLL
jgi:hypothetical protein